MKNLLLLILLLLTPNTHAIILYGTGDPEANTTAPTQPELANSGWQYQGYWGGFCGTPISSNCFLAATHVGGSVGNTFSYHGTSYTAIASKQIGSTDLTVWTVGGTFDSWAPLYTKGDERGKFSVWIGCGTQRGGELWSHCTQKLRPPVLSIEGERAASVTLSPVTNNVVDGWVAGWAWGRADGRMRWGTNVIIVGDFSRYGCEFSSAGADVCCVSSGDSSGAVYVKDTDGAWKLVGIIGFTGNNGPFGVTPAGPFYSGAFLDARGLYYSNANSSGRMSCKAMVTPSRGYMTRVYTSLAEIRAVVGAL